MKRVTRMISCYPELLFTKLRNLYGNENKSRPPHRVNSRVIAWVREIGLYLKERQMLYAYLRLCTTLDRSIQK